MLYWEEAQSKTGILSFIYPMENGVVTSWVVMEKAWRDLYKYKLKMKLHSLGASTADHDPSQSLVPPRKKWLRRCLEASRYLSWLCSARSPVRLCPTTGPVLDGGDGVTVTAPVYKGCYLLCVRFQVGFCRQRCNQIPCQAPLGDRALLCKHSRERNCQGYEGEAVLCCFRP